MKDGETGLLFDAKSILGLTKAIERLLSDDYYLQKLARAAETSVKKRFTWIKAGEEYTNLYKRIVNQQGTLSRINKK
ncbi:MAG: glycosyltransferase [Chloroflexi bacterium]|nr:glycosyltransferase [Chloroflexota bacterium]